MIGKSNAVDPDYEDWRLYKATKQETSLSSSKYMIMKLIFVIASLLLISNISCKKKNEECQIVTITRVGIGTGCVAWAINVKDVNYISDNVPDQFKLDGAVVCAKFELYEDMRLCVCCGGTRASIQFMK